MATGTVRRVTAATSANSWPPDPTPKPRYGTVSRWLHWGMAVCFAIVLAAALVRYVSEKSDVAVLLWPFHRPMGALLMLLVVLRSAWALLQARRRPPQVNPTALWGHRALYPLMCAVPTLALLRQYGSGRAFAPFGLPPMDARAGDSIDWMVELGNLLHGAAGWVLLALAVGHIAMAICHRRSAHDVLPRMPG